MTDNDETYAIRQSIKEIDQEKSMAEKRFKRFKQAAVEFININEKLLKAFGVSSLDELEQLFKKKKFHPEGFAMFEQFLDDRDMEIPGFMKHSAASSKKKTEPIGQKEKPRAKRLKFKL